eukprot:TRINITY_DN2320_c0_g1_i3.p1 TRINITY_DN2320_c0_g1~~TRINITY_DN2320_c0_g1_i3.p1  ORF type:complete len:212 (-),score=18.93 TRINITY_DN2320_c0_g1_i3:276-911(-)
MPGVVLYSTQVMYQQQQQNIGFKVGQIVQRSRGGAVSRSSRARNILVSATVADSAAGRVVNTTNNILSATLKTTTQETSNIEDYVPGKVYQINSPLDLDEFLGQYSDELIVLMCKARTCRPCRAFTKKYMKFAESHKKVVFLEVFGDDSMDNRRLMVKLKVTGTPTFKFFRNGEVVHTHSGIDDEKFSSIYQKIYEICGKSQKSCFLGSFR